MTAFERDPEVTVPKRLDDLAVELDLLFLLGDGAPLLLRSDVDRLGALRAFARLVFDLLTLAEGLEAVPRDVRVMDEEVLLALLRRDESISLGIVEPLDGSGSH
jgi:hypothetical protein